MADYFMRKPGWYWVKRDADREWLPGYWSGTYAKWNVVMRLFDDKHLSEIGPRIPTPDEPFALVPDKITAESGHKAGMIGDFYVTAEDCCPDCEGIGYDDNDDDCELCEGRGELGREIGIPWATIKAIHQRIVELSKEPHDG